MSKNTPITQHLDFENATWDISSSIRYTKTFRKFYTKPDGQVVIENLKLIQNSLQPKPVIDVVALTIDVAINRKVSNDESITYIPAYFKISGVGTFNLTMVYNQISAELTVAIDFTAELVDDPSIP